ncbi:DUF485 domain-containing protein [Pseudanabaena sp. PCC 6802]|uniref:DUF485 domain-containing protein n=1 Tax=Pseudanabaena sp. PCC 6802 TaxID=118173 RepID=UPI00034A2BEA|nr:DUF485 domain-containing protein [Pseudanabaena sp. PCC 6802]
MKNRAKTLDDVAADRWRISMWLTAIMMVIYFGVILLIAYDKPLLATPITPGLSLGILLGALTIAAVWLLTYVYVNWANNVYDVHVAKLQEGLRNMGNTSNRSGGTAGHLTTDAPELTQDEAINETDHGGEG